MALVACKSCNKPVSDRAVVCPHCGAAGPIVNQRTSCPECGQPVVPGIAGCPHCGFPLAPPAAQNTTATYANPAANPNTTHRMALEEWERAREKSAAWTRAELADRRAELRRKTRKRVVVLLGILVVVVAVVAVWHALG